MRLAPTTTACFPSVLNTIPAQQLHNAIRSGGHQQRMSGNNAAEVMVGESVHILVGTDLLRNIFNRDMGRQRQLYDKAIHIIVVVDVVNVFHQLFFRDGIGKTHHGIMEADGLAGFHLVIDIRLACAVIADQDDGQVRNFLPCCFRRATF